MPEQQNTTQQIDTETILDWTGNQHMKLLIQVRALQNQLAQAQDQNAKLVELLDKEKAKSAKK